MAKYDPHAPRPGKTMPSNDERDSWYIKLMELIETAQRQKRECSTMYLVEESGIRERSVKSSLKYLKTKGVIAQVGFGRGGTLWRLTTNTPPMSSFYPTPAQENTEMIPAKPQTIMPAPKADTPPVVVPSVPVLSFDMPDGTQQRLTILQAKYMHHALKEIFDDLASPVV